MKRGSESGWRRVEQIDAILFCDGALQLACAIHWRSPEHGNAASLTVRRFRQEPSIVVCRTRLAEAMGFRPETSVVDPGLTWSERDEHRGLRCPALAMALLVRSPRPGSLRPRGRPRRKLRLVDVVGTADAERISADAMALRAGSYPGLYTQWPLLADTDFEARPVRAPAALATRPIALIRDAEECRHAS